MSAWHDGVVDLTFFEALTGGAFDRQNGNIAGNLTKIFQKSQMPRGLPEGGGWAVLELTGTLTRIGKKQLDKFRSIFSRRAHRDIGPWKMGEQ